MDAATIAALLKPMGSQQIINTLETLVNSGVNTTAIDIPAVLASLNVTQVQGLLSANSSTVDGLLQSLQPVQLVKILNNVQNVTSTLFNAASAAQDYQTAKAYAVQATTLMSLLMEKLQTTFTDNQLLGVFKILSNGAAFGTGSKKMLDIAKNLIMGFFGNFPISSSSLPVPERLLTLVAAYQPAIFGGYPTHKDYAPSAIFMAIFFLFTLIHGGLYMKNRSLGHNFLISAGLAFYSLCRTLGFLLRIVWSSDLTKLDVGLTSTIFIVIPTTMLPSLNLILAQRFFTWKHPVYGSHRLFQAVMYMIYGLVIGVIIMTIIAAAVQINYFLGEKHFHMTQQVIEASSILIVLYSLVAVVLVALAYIIKPTSQDKQVLTFQPTWVESFGWNYFVNKGAAQQAAQSIPEEQKHAVRVINSTAYHHSTISEKPTDVPAHVDLKHGHSILIIVFSTFCLFLSDMFRCVSTFIHQFEFEASWIFDPVVMYVMFGVLETLVNVVFLVGRIDLRFYKADHFGKSLLHSAPVVDNQDRSKEESEEEVKPAESA